MTETREVQIPPAGDPFTAVGSEDYAAARRIVWRERTGPPMDADPMNWLGLSEDSEQDRGR